MKIYIRTDTLLRRLPANLLELRVAFEHEFLPALFETTISVPSSNSGGTMRFANVGASAKASKSGTVFRLFIEILAEALVIRCSDGGTVNGNEKDQVRMSTGVTPHGNLTS